MKNIKNALNRMMVSGQVVACEARNKLEDKQGLDNLVVTVLLIVVAIVAIVVIFWPWVQTFFQNLFTNADAKIESVWNYNG